jgi:hypothetical protein
MEEKPVIKSPWRTIWTNPRQTINTLIENFPSKGMWWMALIAGFQHCIVLIAIWPITITKHILMLVIALVVSPIIGMIWFYYFGGILYIVGKWLGGMSSYRDLKIAYAWSRLPIGIYLIVTAILLFIIPDLQIHKYFVFSSSIVVAIIGFVMGLWALLVLFQNVLEVQKFSPVKALLNIIFSYVINFIIAGILLYSIMLILVKMGPS